MQVGSINPKFFRYQSYTIDKLNLTALWLLDTDIQALTLLPKSYSPLCDRLRIKDLIIRSDCPLNIDQSNMHTAIRKRAAETLHHIPLRRLDQTEREKLRDRVPWEVAVGNEQGGLEGLVGLGQSLEFGNVMLGYYIEGEICGLVILLAFVFSLSSDSLEGVP